MTSFCKSI